MHSVGCVCVLQLSLCTVLNELNSRRNNTHYIAGACVFIYQFQNVYAR